MSRLIYCFRQGFSNIIKNLLFSIASVLTISACIFLFAVFYCLAFNVQSMTHRAETMIGITVLFTEDADQTEKEELKNAILEKGGVSEIIYTSADEAWESFKEDYFGEKSEELAAAFADDNPLANSDSYEIFLDNIEDQDDMAAFISGFDIVREVNYSNSIVSALESLNRAISFISVLIISLLFGVSVFLISNTINLTAHLRRRENEIMKMIGATNGMIRAPFVIEGTLLGLMGAALPIAIIYYLYKRAETMVDVYLSANGSLSALRELAELVPFKELYPVLLGAALILGAGMGFVVSFITIRKHLKV